MKALINRVLTEEPSRELSDEVLKAFGWYHRVDKRLPDREQWGWIAPAGYKGHDVPVIVLSDPDPLRSLDAAVSLVPEDCVSWSIHDSPGGPTAWILMDGGKEYDGFPKPGSRPTPAAAIVGACLQAIDGTQ